MSTMMIRGLLRGVGVGGRRRLSRQICSFSSASFSASTSTSTSSSKSDLDTIEFFDVTIVGGGVCVCVCGLFQNVEIKISGLFFSSFIIFV